MDEIKGIAKKDDFSKFIDAQQVRTDPFGNNRAAERLYRRAERICAALYLLTRHIPEREPIRNEIRAEATSLFEKILNLQSQMRAIESPALLAFESSVRRLISLVRILTAGGFVSFQNADAVIGALDELDLFVSSAQRSDLAEGVFLDREELMGDMSPLSGRDVLKDIRDKRKVKDTTDIKDAQETSERRERKVVVAARAEGILVILREGGGLGIKEICARLPHYSEKMIQRELAILVRDGQVTKEGLKRWSKYSAVS